MNFRIKEKYWRKEVRHYFSIDLATGEKIIPITSNIRRERL
jgi:hypothetical protein